MFNDRKGKLLGWWKLGSIIEGKFKGKLFMLKFEILEKVKKKKIYRFLGL